MKKTSLVWMVTMLAVVGAWGQLRVPLTYNYSSDSYDFSKISTRDPSWGQDTMILRAILDSNNYKGSCIPFITQIVSNSSQINSNPYNVYRISAIQINNQQWLKKVTNNVKQLLYLTNLVLANDTCLISVDSINQYLTYLNIVNATISSLNFDPKFLKVIGITHCKNLKLFSYNLKNIFALSLEANELIDISFLNLGDSVGSNVLLDSNNLTTIPVNVLQTLQKNNVKISVDYNSLGCVAGSTFTTLNEIAIDPNWQLTQKPCTQVINKIAECGKKIGTNYINYVFNIQGKKLYRANYTSSGIYISKFEKIASIIVK